MSRDRALCHRGRLVHPRRPRRAIASCCGRSWCAPCWQAHRYEEHEPPAADPAKQLRQLRELAAS